jgi:hypothetical protein
MKLRIEFEQEDHGRWLAEIPSLPGVMVYGQTRDEASAKVTVQNRFDQIENKMSYHGSCK